MPDVKIFIVPLAARRLISEHIDYVAGTFSGVVAVENARFFLQAAVAEQSGLDRMIELIYQVSITGGDRGPFHDLDAG